MRFVSIRDLRGKSAEVWKHLADEREMIVTSNVEGSARAQPIAEAYLRHFPNGTYAGAAQALRRGQ